MIPIALVLAAHEPWRMRPYNYFDVGRRHDYFDPEATRRRLLSRERLSYAPAAEMLERLLERHERFALSLALSGPLREQLAVHAPRTLDAFRRIVRTGRVEPLSATSHRSLAWPVSAGQIAEQIRLDRAGVERDLGRRPWVFGGEAIADPEALAPPLEAEGFGGMVCDGPAGAAAAAPERILFRAATPGGFPALLSDASLAGDVARRFSNRRWTEWPLTAEKFDGWISRTPGDVLCLRLDFETFGVTHPRESGIFEFFEAWIERALSDREARFWTASEAIAGAGPPAAPLPQAARAAGVGNEMQRDALGSLGALERRIPASSESPIAEDFRRLTGSDHFDRMALPRPGKTGTADSEPFESPYEAYMCYRHALADLEGRLPRPRPERPRAAGPLPA